MAASDWGSVRFVTLRGARYAVRSAGYGQPLLLLHGFTGSSRTWQPIVSPLLATGAWQLVAPDLLGHGSTDAPSDPARYAATEQAADVLALLDALGLDRAVVLGYSMGGRLALHLATTTPQRCRALVLESTSPGLADPTERATRQATDERLALAIEERGLAWFVAYWEQQPLFASQQRLPHAIRERHRAERLAQRPHGLANSLRGFGAGVMPSLWDALPRLDLPVLVITGALDERYLTIGRAMVRRLPHAALAVVPAAGHTVHLEQPAAFTAILLDFLANLVEDHRHPPRR